MSGRAGAGFSGALGGAGSGALAGSFFGPVGTGIGAGLGALLGGIGGYSSFKPDRFRTRTLYTPQQTSALNQLLGNLQQMGGENGNYQAAQSYLGSLLSRDPQVYDRFAAPYLQQFEQETIPKLAERFAGLGAMGGGLSSSGFAQALGGAGAGLQSNLANLFANLQYGAAGDISNQYNQLANLGLGQRTFENFYQPGSAGLAGQLAGSGLGALGSLGEASLMQKLLGKLGQQGSLGAERRTGID